MKLHSHSPKKILKNLRFFYLKLFKILLSPFLFLENSRQAEELKIIPSFSTLKSFALKVSPVDVISETISDEPVNGYASVAPKLSTILNWVTPLENRKSLVRFGYFVATLKCFFFYYP